MLVMSAVLLKGLPAHWQSNIDSGLTAEVSAFETGQLLLDPSTMYIVLWHPIVLRPVKARLLFQGECDEEYCMLLYLLTKQQLPSTRQSASHYWVIAS